MPPSRGDYEASIGLLVIAQHPIHSGEEAPLFQLVRLWIEVEEFVSFLGLGEGELGIMATLIAEPKDSPGLVLELFYLGDFTFFHRTPHWVAIPPAIPS